MPAHRYWRATSFEAYGTGDLELSEFHLLEGESRVDATATVTTSVSPDVSGAVADFQDDVLATAARWSAKAVKSLVLQWDFGGADAAVDRIDLAGGNAQRFPLIFKMQWSDDAVTWVDSTTVAGASWPGNGAFTTYTQGSSDPYVANVSVQMDMEGPNGSTSISDATGKVVTNTSVTISTAQYGQGGSSALFSGAGSHLALADDADFDFGAGDFCIEFYVRPTIIGLQGFVAKRLASSTYAPFLIYTNALGQASALVSLDGASFPIVITDAAVLPPGVWSHIAFDRHSDTFRLFVSGASVGTPVSLSGAVAVNSDPVLVGAADTTTISFDGHLDDVRLTKGRSRYSSNFTPAPMPEYNTYAATGINVVKGRAAPSSLDGTYGAPPATYGIPKIAPPDYLGVESGAVKDQTTGVLGQGVGRVRGTVKEKSTPNAPVFRKVRLIRERDGLVLREQWSDKVTGEYDFQFVDELQKFTVISYDYVLNYRAVVADNLTLANAGVELMP